jgi:eukaryotic-like serine/threonine-protein kinase
MSAENWTRLETLYYAALERPADLRLAYLREACGADDELLGSVESLLAADAVDDDFLARPVLEIAAATLPPPDNELVGKRIAHYEIVSLLGAGGMGEVYLAQDTRLNRKVAIKFLFPDAIADLPSDTRSLSEAQAAAALDHPNVCTVYEAGEAEGLSFIVMQYIEGECLAARLKRKPPELIEALTIGEQVLQALSAAHAVGVIHTDIKPQNILLTPRDEVKVLDFGLAKRLPGSAYESEARPTADSGPRVVGGTAGYMSPEQVQARILDCRTDLFSFGAVLYELITRQQAFPGDTPFQAVTAILQQDPPPLRTFAPDVPEELEAIVRSLLAKQPEARAQTADEVLIELRRLLKRLAPAGRTTSRISRLGLVAATAALAALGIWSLRRVQLAPASPLQYTQLTHFSDGATAPILSPDERLLGFIRGGASFLSRGQIWVKELPDGEPRQLTHESKPIATPYFSPDGTSIAYTIVEPPRAAWDTWTVPVSGGAPRKLFSNTTGLTWIGPGRILFSQIRSGMHMGLVTSAESQSDIRDIYFPAHERGMVHYSYLSPDSQWVLLVEMDHTAAFRSCRLIPFDGSSNGKLVGPEGMCTSAAWSPDRKWMYFVVLVNGESHVWRQRFPDGTPEQLTFGPMQESGLAVARDGRSLTTAMGLSQGVLWIHERTGDRALSPEGAASAPMFSATSPKIYYLLSRASVRRTRELWVTDLISGKSEPLVTGFDIRRYDVISDETEAVVSAESGGKRSLWLVPLRSKVAPTQIAEVGDHPSYRSNGEILFQGMDGRKNYLYKMGRDRSRTEKVVPWEISTIRNASEDGEWVMVMGPNAQGAPAHRVIPVSGGESVELCTGACIARWSPDGRLFQITFSPAEQEGKGETFVVPLAPGQMLPPLPPYGFRSGADLEKLPGVRRITDEAIAIASTPGTYAYVKTSLSQNIYRIALPR